MKVRPMLGTFAIDGIEFIESSESRALVEHRVPGLEGSYFQDMGTVPNTIVIWGTKHGDEQRDAFLEGIRELFNAGEPTTFVADINTATDLTEVLIEDLQVAEVAGSADTFRYHIKLRKYVEPPEPVATGLLDDSILDDALSLTDALDLIDALGSTPNLGDPTRPLLQTLDGIQSATGGLDQVVSDLRNLFGAEETETGGDEGPGVGPVAAEETSGELASGIGAPEEAPAGESATAVEAGAGEILPSLENLGIDPADPRIDQGTKSILQGMIEDPETAETASGLVRGINGETLGGILGSDSDEVLSLADIYGIEPSQLVPSGQDAALVLDPEAPLEAPPTIVLRSGEPDIRNDPTRLGAALEEVGRTFELFERGEIGRCASTASAVQVPNLMPSTFCRVPLTKPGVPDAREGLEREPEAIDPSAPELRIDPADQRIDVGAKFALQRMLNSSERYIAADAARLIRGINDGTLAGIYGDDLAAAVRVARAHGTERWLLVPEGEDAALVLEPEQHTEAPLEEPPTVIFRGDTPDIRDKPDRIEPALQDVSETFKLWQQRELESCDNSTWVVSVPNLVPSSYCTSMGIPPGTSACTTLKRPEILDRFDQGKSDLKLPHKRKIRVIAHCVRDRHGTPNAVDLISLIGHASTEGDPGFNETLGQRRAEEVRKKLIIALDIEMPGLSSRVQIETDTRGPRESRNLGREKDRRVEVFLPHMAISTARDLFVAVTSAEDGLTGTHLQGATVEVMGPLISEKLTKNTEEDGQARFQGLEPGTYEVTARKEGFEEASIKVLHPLEQDLSAPFVPTPTTHSLEVAQGEQDASSTTGKVVITLQPAQTCQKNLYTKPQKGNVSYSGIQFQYAISTRHFNPKSETDVTVRTNKQGAVTEIGCRSHRIEVEICNGIKQELLMFAWEYEADVTANLADSNLWEYGFIQNIKDLTISHHYVGNNAKEVSFIKRHLDADGIAPLPWYSSISVKPINSNVPAIIQDAPAAFADIIYRNGHLFKICYSATFEIWLVARKKPNGTPIKLAYKEIELKRALVLGKKVDPNDPNTPPRRIFKDPADPNNWVPRGGHIERKRYDNGSHNMPNPTLTTPLAKNKINKLQSYTPTNSSGCDPDKLPEFNNCNRMYTCPPKIQSLVRIGWTEALVNGLPADVLFRFERTGKPVLERGLADMVDDGGSRWIELDDTDHNQEVTLRVSSGGKEFLLLDRQRIGNHNVQPRWTEFLHHLDPPEPDQPDLPSDKDGVIEVTPQPQLVPRGDIVDE